MGLGQTAEQTGVDNFLSPLKNKRPEKLTPAEMKTYQEGRAMFDDLFKRINQARELAGKKPMGKVDNYYTWMRNFEALKELGIDPVFSDTQVVRKHLPKKGSSPRTFLYVQIILMFSITTCDLA